VGLTLNDNGIFYIWIGNSNENNSSASVIRKINSFTSFSSAHTIENSSIYGLFFKFLYVVLSIIFLFENMFFIFIGASPKIDNFFYLINHFEIGTNDYYSIRYFFTYLVESKNKLIVYCIFFLFPFIKTKV